jgi:hypothetical protein
MRLDYSNIFNVIVIVALLAVSLSASPAAGKAGI